MIDIKQIWRAGRVRRWHMNPDLADTVDPVDGHSARVARLWLALFGMDATAPVIARMTVAALLHDDEELFIGDLARPVKDMHPTAYAKIEKAGEVAACDMWGLNVWAPAMLSPNEVKQLKFCDKLDAFMWADHHDHLRVWTDPAWLAAWKWIRDESEALDVKDQILALLG